MPHPLPALRLLVPPHAAHAREVLASFACVHGSGALYTNLTRWNVRCFHCVSIRPEEESRAGQERY